LWDESRPAAGRFKFKYLQQSFVCTERELETEIQGTNKKTSQKAENKELNGPI